MPPKNPHLHFLISKKIIFFILIFILVIIFLAGLILGKRLAKDSFFISPLGRDSEDKFLKIAKKLKTIDQDPPSKYFPQSYTPVLQNGPKVKAQSYAVMDRKEKTLLFAKNHLQEKPIASLAKIMTAIIALENAPLDLEITISSSAAEIGEAAMGLSPGERLTLEELLYGALLPSGNDAATAIASDLAKKNGFEDGFWFVNKMNEKAQNLGLFDTYFVNPTGLDEEEENLSSFSTALDLLALANYALENKKFSEIVATEYKLINDKEGFHKTFQLYNILGLSKTYEGIKGIKPGKSVLAGDCLASYLEKDGREIIVILLNSPSTKEDALAIYDYLFGKQIGGREKSK